ncbi:helix-turn-helix domain-containing protein [Brevibacillus laterosporus]|uniref:helix-turn-helix domain-containing protein n=1 Tax=Brevibacillus laterosporus TaxID=1465 RepID=UPI002E1FFE2F|nr:helix-turn-helix domain-containing protein [Brevibacillus laterosporus]
MERIGFVMKEARISKGISLADIHKKTNIPLSYLEAIEQEEFSKIPHQVYVQGFVKSYASVLKLDVTAYMDQLPKPEPSAPPNYITHQRKWKLGSFFLSGTGFCQLLVVIFMLFIAGVTYMGFRM